MMPRRSQYAPKEEGDPCTGGSPTSYLNKRCSCSNCKQLSREYRRNRYLASHEHYKKRLRDSYARNKTNRLNYKLVKAYGITAQQRQEMLEKQKGVCAICGGDGKCGASAPDSKLHVDHCHASGVVRGLLCAHCNRALGLLNDDPNTLRAAALYLEKYRVS